MQPKPTYRALILALALAVCFPSLGRAQILGKIKDTAKGAAESEVLNRVGGAARGGVSCLFSNLACVRDAQAAGDEVQLTDENGQVVLDEDGNPVSDPDQAAALLGRESPAAAASAPTPPGAAGSPGTVPGGDANVNVDFVPGDRVVLETDYSEDNLGDFPRRFDLLQGSFDVIEWNGARYVRAISAGAFAIALPETLPEKFTLETTVSVQHGNASLRITPGRAYRSAPATYRGSAVSVEYAEAGLLAVGAGPSAMAGHDHAVVATALAPLKVMADGEHMKVYLGARRVANVPNAIFPRTDTLFVDVASAFEETPVLIGPIRIAASHVDLYDRLTREGRVTTHGILFDVNSDVIQAESSTSLEQIGTMLLEHPELRISIEGHTDSDGEEAFNQDLSERRAAAVKHYLVDRFGVDADRLGTRGFGESVPVAPNDTPHGKQQNRRVELVLL